ncbi:MAG: ABC transporter permease [Acidimicrobiia bacterium]
MELRAKYKASALGFVWSLLNPAMYLVVFYVAFNLILGAGIPRYPIYLLSGLLVWNLFTTALAAGTGSIVANAGLVKKVWFPREVLALSAIGAAVVHFLLQSLVLVAALAVFRHPVDVAFLPLLPLALFALLLLVSGLALLLSALNVYLRDIQHFLELALLAWFWMTPVIYSYNLITAHFDGGNFPALLNPVTPIVLTFQRALYGSFGGPDVVPLGPGVLWHLRNLGVVIAAASVLLVIALTVFRRLEGNLAEEL